jgi:hypothetical protein
MDDESLLWAFEHGTLSPDEWHHREHIKVAYLLLRKYPLDRAIDRMRAGLQILNKAHRVPDTVDRGYHETITQAWMRLVDFILGEYGAAIDAEHFFNDHPELSQRHTLRLFYSRDRILSLQAKAEYLPPDLHPISGASWPNRSSAPNREPRPIEAKIVLGCFWIGLAALVLSFLGHGRGSLFVILLLLAFVVLPIYIAVNAIAGRHSSEIWASRRARNIAIGIFLGLIACVGIGSRIWGNSEFGSNFVALGAAALLGMPVVVAAWLFTREVKPRISSKKELPSSSAEAIPHPLD